LLLDMYHQDCVDPRRQELESLAWLSTLLVKLRLRQRKSIPLMKRTLSPMGLGSNK